MSAPRRSARDPRISASLCRPANPVPPTRRAAGTLDACHQPGAPPLPVGPMLATPGPPPAGAGFFAEAKWDGARGIARVHGGGVDLISRPGNNFCSRFPDLTESLAQSLGGHSAILDGEVIARDGHGRPSFARLQRRLRVQRPSRTLLSSVPASFCRIRRTSPGWARPHQPALRPATSHSRRSRPVGWAHCCSAGVAGPPRRGPAGRRGRARPRRSGVQTIRLDVSRWPSLAVLDQMPDPQARDRCSHRMDSRPRRAGRRISDRCARLTGKPCLLRDGDLRTRSGQPSRAAPAAMPTRNEPLAARRSPRSRVGQYPVGQATAHRRYRLPRVHRAPLSPPCMEGLGHCFTRRRCAAGHPVGLAEKLVTTRRWAAVR